MTSPQPYPQQWAVESVPAEEFVRAVQRRHGIKVDGVVGPQTWCAVFTGDPISPDALRRLVGDPPI